MKHSEKYFSEVISENASDCEKTIKTERNDESQESEIGKTSFNKKFFQASLMKDIIFISPPTTITPDNQGEEENKNLYNLNDIGLGSNNEKRAQHNRNKSIVKFKDNLFSIINNLLVILGFKMQKVYIKKLLGKNKGENKIFFEKTIKNIFCESIPKNIPKKGNNFHNKQIIEELEKKKQIDEEKEKIRIIILHLMEKTVEEMYNKYIENDKFFAIFNNTKFILLDLEYFENKYNFKYKTFNDDENRKENKKYENNARLFAKQVMDKEKGFVGRPKARGKKLKKNDNIIFKIFQYN